MAPQTASLNYFTCTLSEAAEFRCTNFETVNSLLDVQARKNPTAYACGFPIPAENAKDWSHVLFTYKDLRDVSIAAAAELSVQIKATRDIETSTCIALLCPSSVEFLFAWLGLIRAGFAVLLIAPQCPAEAIAHLCKSCDSNVLLYDEMYEDLASVAATKSRSLTVQPLAWRYGGRTSEDIKYKPRPFTASHYASSPDVAYIHHTSGTSSGLPKPIVQTHHGGLGVLPSLERTDKATFTTTPLYHGGVADCFRAWTSSELIWLFPGKDCPITTRNIISSLSVTSCIREPTGTKPSVAYFSSVPYILQMLAEDPDGLRMLQDMDIVGVGGAALPVQVGDELVRNGVALVSRFGSAECGFLLSSHRNYDVDGDWQYLRLSEPSSKLLSFEAQPNGTGLFELIVQPEWPHMAKRNRPDRSLATSDLFEAHPTICGAWRYHSRSDNQITLLTGKKFDPAPMEDEISSRLQCVQEVLIFGNGKQAPGALIFPRADTEVSLTALHGEIWSAVQSVNAKSQNHMRITRNMMVILDFDCTPLARSSKGALLRATAENEYRAQIESVYGHSAAQTCADNTIAGSTLDVVRGIVNNFLDEPLEDDQVDFYKNGLDSATCTQIRSLIQKKLFNDKISLPWNMVYDCGSIAKLAEYISGRRDGGTQVANDSQEEMLFLVKKYSVFSQSVCSRQHQIGKRAVLLTGATGALGSHILNLLRRDPSLSIYCLVRATDEHAASERVSNSLKSRRLAPLGKEVAIHCLSAQLGKGDLGLQQDVLQSLKQDLAAWTVNFSLPLRSFEDGNIRGLHNLLEFVMSCVQPAQFVFCSSTASVLGANHPMRIPEALSTSPSDADSLGYSQSKWVAESICRAVSKEKDMATRVKILRIGQLTGDTINGVWNMSEAWPMMLSTIFAVDCLPRMEDKLSWLPLDVAAHAVVDIALQDSGSADDSAVFHLVNNSIATSWMDMLHWIQETSRKPFEIVETNIWLKKLEKLESHPAKNLTWLWHSNGKTVRDNAESDEPFSFDIEHARKISEAMRDVQPVGRELVQKIWRWLESRID